MEACLVVLLYIYIQTIANDQMWYQEFVVGISLQYVCSGVIIRVQ